jgi:hypothetical protein
LIINADSHGISLYTHVFDKTTDKPISSGLHKDGYAIRSWDTITKEAEILIVKYGQVILDDNKEPKYEMKTFPNAKTVFKVSRWMAEEVMALEYGEKLNSFDLASKEIAEAIKEGADINLLIDFRNTSQVLRSENKSSND